MPDDELPYQLYLKVLIVVVLLAWTLTAAWAVSLHSDDAAEPPPVTNASHGSATIYRP